MKCTNCNKKISNCIVEQKYYSACKLCEECIYNPIIPKSNTEIEDEPSSNKCILRCEFCDVIIPRVDSSIKFYVEFGMCEDCFNKNDK